VETARLVPIPARTKAKAPSGSHRVLAWTSALAVVLVLAGAGGFWLRSRGQARAAAARARAAAQAAAQAAVQAAAPAPPPAAVPEPPARAQPVLEAPAPQVASTAKPPYTTLDAAADALGKDPEGALAFLDQTVAAEPGNERACALRIVALYNLARYGASGKAIREAREAGHPLWPMALRNPPLREMLERDVKGQHLPKRKAAPAPAPAPETAPEEPAA
jgi:hypothetical protein